VLNKNVGEVCFLSIDKLTVKKVLGLSALKAKESEIETLSEQLSKILEHMKALDAVEVNNIKPMFFGIDKDNCATRTDEPVVAERELIKTNALSIVDDLYCVPNIIVGDDE
jgi:aspartyl/glutamyl-tRNA(Asn/Gln) amidotransferase C subunit